MSQQQRKLIRLLRPLLAAQGVQIPINVHVRRLYPGARQRDAGAWSWTLERDDGDPILRTGDIGSQWSVSRLLVATGLEVTKIASGDYDITPLGPVASGGPQ